MPIGSNNPATISDQQSEALARFKPMVISLVDSLSKIHDPAYDRDDLIQIGLMEAFKASKLADGREGREAFIERRVRWRMMDVLRRIKPHYSLSNDQNRVDFWESSDESTSRRYCSDFKAHHPNEIADDGDEPDDEKIRQEYARLQPLLDLLGQRQREAVQLRFLSGMDYPTLARRFGTTKSGAWRVVDRGVRRLRKWSAILEENHVTPAWSALVAQLLWRGLGGSTMPSALVRECVHIGEQVKRENPLLNGQTGKAVKHAIYERVRDALPSR